jgi:hypothetical protein
VHDGRNNPDACCAEATIRKIYYQIVSMNRILAPRLHSLPMFGRKVDKKPPDLVLEVGTPKQ